MTMARETNPAVALRVFPRVLGVVMLWQVLQFAGGLVSFVSLWPAALAGVDGVPGAEFRGELLRGHAAVLLLGYLPTGLLLALLVYPFVRLWWRPGAGPWGVVWRTVVMCASSALLASAALVQFRPWLMTGMDGGHWYLKLQQQASPFVRAQLLPTLLRGIPAAAVCLAGAWYAVRLLRWLRPACPNGVARVTGLAAAAAIGVACFLLMQTPAAVPSPASAGGALPKPVMRARPNVLVIAGDSLRADHLSCNDGPPGLTPAIDSLAADGVNFRRCFTPVNGSVESMTSLLTGQYPHTHGLQHPYPGMEEAARLASGAPRLADLLSREGYETVVMGDAGSGMFEALPLGFDDVETAAGGSARSLLGESLCASYPILPLWLDNAVGRRLMPGLARSAPLMSPEVVTDRLVKRLRERAADARPFFWTVYFSCARLPYANGPDRASKITRPGYAGRHRSRLQFDPVQWPALMEAAIRSRGLTPEDREQVKALYAGSVSRFDDCVGRVLDALRRSGQLERTIVLITGDHGEDLFEPGCLPGHGAGFSGGDQSIHVPAVLHVPGGRGGRNVPDIVRSIDLAPTLLDLCGVTPDGRMEGVSLRSYLEGGTGSLGLAAYAESSRLFPRRLIPGERPLQSEPPLPPIEVSREADGRIVLKAEHRAAVLQTKERMLRTERWKLVFTPGEQRDILRLYDLASDPHCERDVGPLHPEVLSRLREHLWEWMRERRDHRIPEIFPKGEPSTGPGSI